MAIADAEKAKSMDSHDLKNQKARQRAFLKRRATQLVNGQSQSSRNICTDLQRHWSRQRIRRLLSGDKHMIKEVTVCAGRKRRNSVCYWYTFVSLFLTVGLACCLAWYQNNEAVTIFLRQYSNRYQALVHNDLNYCDRSMPLGKIFNNLRENVLNQEAALNQLEQALANQSSFQSIALVGTSGVGKSLTISILLEQYPWTENIQSLAWNDFELISQQARYRKVSSMLKNLAHCGRNLVVIDNMFPYDMEYVASINKLVRARCIVPSGRSNLDVQQLAIIYIFKLNRMLPDDIYDHQLKMLQNLSQTTVINYRSFDSTDLERCVRHEAKLVNLSLEERYIEEMVNTTDVRFSGCKTVRSKVLVYGQPQKDSEQYGQ